jgi:hypothetical protein
MDTVEHRELIRFARCDIDIRIREHRIQGDDLAASGRHNVERQLA